MTVGYIPVGWYQLRHNKLRLLAAVAGISFAVVLMLVQQGFREAMFNSSLRWHHGLEYDLIIISPKTEFLVQVHAFPRNRVLQAAGYPGVNSVTPVYMDLAEYRNPVDRARIIKIFVAGFDPTDSGFDSIISDSQKQLIQLPDRALFDRGSRVEFGPVVEMLGKHSELPVEVNNRRITLSGLFEIGNSFGIDGALLTSDLNFQRLFPNRPAAMVSLGLIGLATDTSREAAQARIRAGLPEDVLVLTPQEFQQREVDYWNFKTPIGYVFNFGVIMGFAVGAIIVYQILFSDVQDHLKEYATLKAIGYNNFYLSRVVIQEALILSLLGFIPGAALSHLLFERAGEATNLPLVLTPALASGVFALTLAMCVASALLAMRKLRAADPADVF